MIPKLRGHRPLHLDHKDDEGYPGDMPSNNKQGQQEQQGQQGQQGQHFGASFACGKNEQSTKALGDRALTSSRKLQGGDDILNSAQLSTERKVSTDCPVKGSKSAGSKKSSRVASPWDNSDERNEKTADVIDKMLKSHWAEQQEAKGPVTPIKKKESLRSHITLSPASPTSTGFINRSNGVDLDDDNEIGNGKKSTDQQGEEEDSLASIDHARSPQERKNRFTAQDRAYSSETMKHLFEKSLMAQPEHRPLKKFASEDAARPKNDDHKDDVSFTFDDVVFPDPKESCGSFNPLSSPKKLMGNNSNGSASFEKSPFTSSGNAASSLRNFIGRGSGLTKQTSFRSIESHQTKSTIDGGASGEAERKRNQEPPRNDSQPKLPTPPDARRIARGLGLSKSSSVPHLAMAQSSAHRRTKTVYGMQAPNPSPLGIDDPSTPLASSRMRKTLHNAPPNPLNPAPEGGKWTNPDEGLNNLSNMLLARKQARQVLAENIEGSGAVAPTGQSRRSVTAKMERHTSASPAPRQGSLGSRSPRPGSCRKMIPEDNARSQSRRSQRGRSTSPHSLAKAVAAAAIKQRSTRSPSIGRSSRYRTITRTQSPRAGAERDGRKRPQTPPPKSPSSQSMLSPEQIVDQIRAGNFKLKLEDLLSDRNGPTSNSPGRITLEVKSASEGSVNKSPHSNSSSGRANARGVPTRMPAPIVGNSSQDSSLASPDGHKLEPLKSGSSRRISRKSNGSQSPTGRRPRTNSHSSVGNDEDFQAGTALTSHEYAKSPRRGRRQEVLDDGHSNDALSRSPSFQTRRRASGSHRFPSGLRDRVVPGKVPSTSRHGEERRSISRQSSSRDSKSTPTKARQERNSSSGRARSRSRSKERRSRLRRPDSGGDVEDQPEMPGNPFATNEPSAQKQRSTNAPQDAVDVRRSSRQSMKEQSPSRRHEKSRNDVVNARQSPFRQSSPSTSRRRTGKDTGECPLTGSSPGRVHRTLAPAIIVSPIDPFKGKSTRRSPHVNRSQSDRNLFSSLWAQEINDANSLHGGGSVNDENQRQPQLPRPGAPPPPPPLPTPPKRSVQSSRHLL